MKHLRFNTFTDALEKVNKTNSNPNSGNFAVFSVEGGYYHVDVYSGHEVSNFARSVINDSLNRNLGSFYLGTIGRSRRKNPRIW